MKALIVIAALLLAPDAFAEQKCASPDGKKSWVDGVKAYNLGKYEDAVKHWEAAYASCSDAEILFNLAQAHRKAGHHAQARELYKSWLREEDSIDPVERADVEKKLVELEALIAAEKKSKEGPSEDVRRQPPPTTTPAPRDVARPYRAWKWITLTAGVVAAAGGVTLIALDEDEFTSTAARKPEHTESMTAGIALTATGAALIGTGVVLWILDRPSGRGTTAAFAPTDGGAVFVIGGRF